MYVVGWCDVIFGCCQQWSDYVVGEGIGINEQNVMVMFGCLMLDIVSVGLVEILGDVDNVGCFVFDDS